MTHDFKNFPELTNSQMAFYYFDSPHKQIFENFQAKVIRVIDGDTIRVMWDERDFDFAVRLSDIDAPEMDSIGGIESKIWLKDKIEGREVEVLVDPRNRVEKWGRLLCGIISDGLNINDLSLIEGASLPFE